MRKKGKMLIGSRHAQIAIFIIMALVIVIALLVLMFYPKIKSYIVPPDAREYIQKCTQDSVKEKLQVLESQGGRMEPQNYMLYQGNKVDYSCYTEDYLKPCVMQKPFLKQEIEQELAASIEPEVKSCFEAMKDRLESQGSSVSISDIKTEVSLIPNSAVITIRAPTTIQREGAVSFSDFQTKIDSQVYDLVMLESSISNYEARYGDSNTLAYMMLYPDIRVEKIERDEGRVYILTHKPTNEKLMFASRSIAWPAGYLGV
jgi:hypothetical protein